MKVEIKLQEDILEAYAVIYTAELTEEVSNLVKRLKQNQESFITVKKEEKIHILPPEEIAMVRMEEQQVVLYSKKECYR